MSEDVTGKSNVLDFFDKHGKEGADAVESSFDSADSQQRVDLSISGRYRMKVATFGYVKDNEFKVFPNIYESAKKKALMLTVSLRVVDGTPLVPKGASLFHNIVLSPAPGAKPETVEAIARMSKPQLVALYGKDDVHANAEWFISNCLPKFEKDKENDRYNLIKDHNLQAEVMVEVADDYYNNRETLKVKSILPAGPNDKSVTNQPKQLKDLAKGGPDASDGATVISDDAADDIADSVMGDDTIKPEDDVIEAGTPEGGETAPQSETEDF